MESRIISPPKMPYAFRLNLSFFMLSRGGGGGDVDVPFFGVSFSLSFFFIQYKNLQNEVLKTIGLQTTKLHNKNDNPESKKP